MPPPHSAIKIGGKKAYELARKGKEVEMKSRKVEISVFEISAIEMPKVHFRIVCSKGTYIRSLAHDFGKALHSGACLDSLCRTRIGEYRLDQAITWDQLQEKLNSEGALQMPGIQ
jgi:tRNA pseudouridine55 synthase